MKSFSSTERGTSGAVGTTPNADEQIEVHWKPLEEVLEMAVDGRIRDAKTIVALFRSTHLST